MTEQVSVDKFFTREIKKLAKIRAQYIEEYNKFWAVKEEHERLKRLDENVKKEIEYYKTTDIKEFIIDDIVNLLEDLYK